MVLSLELDTGLEQCVRREATRLGVALEDCVRSVLTREVTQQDLLEVSDGRFCALASELTLAKIWNDPVEDEAWQHL